MKAVPYLLMLVAVVLCTCSLTLEFNEKQVFIGCLLSGIIFVMGLGMYQHVRPAGEPEDMSISALRAEAKKHGDAHVIAKQLALGIELHLIENHELIDDIEQIIKNPELGITRDDLEKFESINITFEEGAAHDVTIEFNYKDKDMMSCMSLMTFETCRLS